MIKALTLREIPEKYKKLKLLGRGKTSIVYDLGNDKVLLFTKDPLKYNWLKKIMTDIKIIDILPSKERFEHPITIIELPKLYPLDYKEDMIINKLCLIFEKLYEKLKSKYKEKTEEIIFQLLKNKLGKKFKEFEKYEKAFVTLKNELGSNYALVDCHVKNFMKDKDGNIIPIDIFISEDILNYIKKSKK